MDYRRPSLIARIALPFRGAAQRFALGFLVLASFALVFLSKTDVAVMERARTAVTDVVAPILEALVQPVSAVNQGLNHIGRLAVLHEENQSLRKEVARLRDWHGAALRLEAENKSFREMLAYRGPARRSFVSARVIADGRGPFVKSVLVNTGRGDGVEKGQTAATALGLVGRVSESGARSARILMITDLNSRIPVLIEESRARAILAGDNSQRPQLLFLPDGARVSVGQRVVTSGHGGALPHGIPVGVVSALDDGVIRIRPFVDWKRLEYVQIIKYDAPPPPSLQGPAPKAAR